MHTAVIIDVIAAAVLLGFFIYGGRRGLFRSIAGLLILVLSLVGAGLFSDYMTPKAANLLQPLIEKRVEARVEARVDAAMNGSSDSAGTSAESSSGGVVMPEEEMPDTDRDTEEPGGETSPSLNAGQLLKLLGIDRDPTESLVESAQKKVRDTGVSVMSAVVESLAETVLRVLLFVLALLLLLVGLKLLMHAVDLVLGLPGLHGLNRLGGAAFGIVEGALVLFLAVWILRRFGVSFDTDTVNETILMRFFATHTPLSVLSFLK